MNLIIAPTEEGVLKEKTKISSDEAAGQTQISVNNAQGFEVDDYVIIGRLGNDLTELLQIDSIADDLKSITLKSATKNAHNEDEPITEITYNQRKFYRASSKTGTFSHLSSEGSPVTIEADNPPGTHLEDTSGDSSSWYKATYYNSNTGSESSLSDAVASKAGETDHYTSIYRIRRKSGFEDATGIKDEVIAELRDEAENEFEGRIAVKYSVPLSTKPTIGRQIVTLIAAGNLLAKEYGVEADIDISKSGERMLSRAYDLIADIKTGEISLVDADGNLISTSSNFESSGSNTYNGTAKDKGEVFTLEDENFKMADPETGEGSTSK